MLTTLSRATCRKHYPSLPTSKYRQSVLTYPKIYGQYVFTLPSKSAQGHAKNIAIALQKLMVKMGYDKLVFMGDANTPWLYRTSDYKPAKAAVEYLASFNLSKTFDGGLVVNVDELYPFITHLFWLVRTNTVLPYVYGINEGQNILVNICQYGSLHIDALDKAADDLLQANIALAGLKEREGNTCLEPWGKRGKIIERQLTV